MTYVVPQSEGGLRLDQILVAHVSGHSRRKAARLLEAGHVQLDGNPAKKGMLVRPGQRLDVTLETESEVMPQPDLPLELLLVRDDLVVVDKPAGLPSGGVPGGNPRTLAAGLAARFPEMLGLGHRPREPGLVHRLDTFTSGALVAARTHEAFDALRNALSRGQLEKRYQAITAAHEVPEFGIIEAALIPHPKNRRKVRVLAAEAARGRFASTRFEVVERRGKLTLLELRVAAAYRHQIRAHLSFMGWPIVGDRLYGGPRHSALGESRHALHASFVGYAGTALPAFAVSCRLPEDMLRLLDCAG